MLKMRRSSPTANGSFEYWRRLDAGEVWPPDEHSAGPATGPTSVRSRLVRLTRAMSAVLRNATDRRPATIHREVTFLAELQQWPSDLGVFRSNSVSPSALNRAARIKQIFLFRAGSLQFPSVTESRGVRNCPPIGAMPQACRSFEHQSIPLPSPVPVAPGNDLEKRIDRPPPKTTRKLCRGALNPYFFDEPALAERLGPSWGGTGL